MEFSIVGEIDNYLKKKEEENSRDNNTFHASDMGRCKLMRYWKRLGIEGTKTEARSLRIFAVGDIVHTWIQNITKERGLSVLSEKKLEYVVDGRVLATGHCDDLLKVGEDEFILYDYKTIHSRGFHYLKEDAHGHYKKQAILYAMMIKQQNPNIKLAGVRILYISKDDLCTKELSVEINEEKIKANHDELLILNKHFDEKKEPKAVPEGEWECSKTYCPYYLKCERGIAVETGKQQKSAKKVTRL